MPTVAIEVFEDEVRPLGRAVVAAVDVLRATTTAVTAVALGRRCLPVPSLETAAELSRRLDGALLGGELGGHTPYGFEITNSPAAVSARTDRERPLILLSSSGTRMLCAAEEAADEVYVASLRNVTATARALARDDRLVVVLGAATRGEFREEDQLCCAWIAARLAANGYEAADARTAELVDRWATAPADALTVSRSVAYLADTGQLRDLDFVLEHVDDLGEAFRMEAGEVVPA